MDIIKKSQSSFNDVQKREVKGIPRQLRLLAFPSLEITVGLGQPGSFPEAQEMGLLSESFPFLSPFAFEAKVVDSITHVIFHLLHLFNSVNIHPWQDKQSHSF